MIRHSCAISRTTSRNMQTPRLPETPEAAVSRRMARKGGRDNASERAIRSALHKMGLRFRLHVRLIPHSTRTVDVALAKARIAVLVDGCFWHGCPMHGTMPKRNSEWWRDKIA